MDGDADTGAPERAFKAPRAKIAPLRQAIVEERAHRGGIGMTGVILGVMLFTEINRRVPDELGWSTGWAAWLMQARTPQDGYKCSPQDSSKIVRQELSREAVCDSCTLRTGKSARHSGSPTTRANCYGMNVLRR